MNNMNDNENSREFVPIEENEQFKSSNILKKIPNFFEDNIKNEESIIHKTKDLNDSNSISLDPILLFGKKEEPVDTIIQPSNTFNFNLKEKEDIASNNFKAKLSNLIDNCGTNTKAYNSKINYISKSNNFEFCNALKSRNNSINKNITFHKHNKTVSKYELNFVRTKQDEEKDYFLDLYKETVKKSKIFDEKIQKVISLHKYNNNLSTNTSTFFQQNSLFNKKLEQFKKGSSPNKKSFVLTVSQKKDSFLDFTPNKPRESRNIYSIENSIPKSITSTFSTTNKFLGSRILKDNRFKNILRSTFNL